MTGPRKLRITLDGRPRGKGRPRASGRIIETPRGRGVAISMYTPEQTRATQRLLRDQFKRLYPSHRPFTGPVMIRFTAVFAIPKGFTVAQRQAALRGEMFHTGKPDKDNVEKLISDALNGLAWIDDAQLQGGGVKRYGQVERIDIVLEALDQPVPNNSDKSRVGKISQGRLL